MTTNLPSDSELDTLMSKVKGNIFTTKNGALLGSILCSVSVEWDDKIPTACTNGKYIKFNRQFFYNLPFKTRITILLHELWHIAFMHMARINDRNPAVWNIAADHAINILLKKEGHSFEGKFLGGNSIEHSMFCDFRYDNMSTENIYEKLLKQFKDNKPNPDPNTQDLRPAEEGKDTNDIIGAVVTGIQSAERSNKAGDIPGEIKSILDKFLNPQLPWEVILQQFFNDLSSFDYSYRRPNRRYQDNDFLSPSMESHNGMDHICYYVDVSGSISDEEILLFNSEVKYIKDTINPKLLTLVLFDTQIQEEYEFTDQDSFDSIVVVGRGGTDLEPVEKHIKEHRPDAAVIFSDLYVEPMHDPGIPVIWAVVNSDIVPTFGTHLKLNT